MAPGENECDTPVDGGRLENVTDKGDTGLRIRFSLSGHCGGHGKTPGMWCDWDVVAKDRCSSPEESVSACRKHN